MLRFLFGRNPRVTLVRAAAMVLCAVVMFGWLLVPVRLQGISMAPTYRDGALNFANRLAYVGHRPARGDVIAIRMAGPHVLYVKRIVGLPGERVEVAMGTVVVNGEPLIEPAVVNKAPWNLEPFTLDPGEYFVIGDNRAMAMANHDFGRVARSRIVGRMLF